VRFRHLTGNALAFACLATLCAVVAPTTATAAQRPNTLWPAAPLASATTTEEGAWALVAMGHLHDPLNTFWQVLFLGSHSSHWVVVTPPGVADNGGLVVAPTGSGDALVGFETSQNLTFSPLALTPDSGATWVPGLLNAPLATSPDSLAYRPGSSAAPGRALALSGSTVLGTGPTFESWSRLASLRSLRFADPECRPARLAAVALGPGSAPLVALDCARNGGLALLSRQGGEWRAAGLRLANQQPGVVLRLFVDGDLTTVLGGADRGAHQGLVAAWEANGRWVASPFQALPRGATLDSTAVGPAGSILVVVRLRGRAMLFSLTGPHSNWVQLARLPPQCSTAAIEPTGAIDAFAVHGGRLDVFSLAADHWVHRQTTTIAIAYGSSN